MTMNLERFEKDLEKLINQGTSLELAMKRVVVGESEFKKRISGQLGKEDAQALLKTLPSFNATYEAWYSETLALLRQTLPDRVQNFISFYEKPKGRKDINVGNYVIQDFLQGLTASRMGEEIVGTGAAQPQFRQQLAILKAIKARFKSSLFELRQLVQADVFDSEIEVARELLKHKFTRAAGAIAGVVLEKHLQQVCQDHGLKITKKNPAIGDLNDLLKNGSVIDVPQWRHISMLGDIRNLCAHNKQKEPTVEQVTDLIDGADKIIRTVA